MKKRLIDEWNKTVKFVTVWKCKQQIQKILKIEMININSSLKVQGYKYDVSNYTESCFIFELNDIFINSGHMFLLIHIDI